MFKIYKLLIFIVLISLYVAGCDDHSGLFIVPVSKEYNEQFLTGKGLDKRLFDSSNVMQYYQISNTENLTAKMMLDTIGKFVDLTYPLNRTDSLKRMAVFFYKKRFFVDYSLHVYESARDSENGTLEGYTDDLVARVDCEKFNTNKQRVARRMVVYLHR